MVSKADEPELVNFALFKLSFGEDVLSQEEAMKLAKGIQELIVDRTKIKVVSFSLEGYDYLTCNKPHDLKD